MENEPVHSQEHPRHVVEALRIFHCHPRNDFFDTVQVHKKMPNWAFLLIRKLDLPHRFRSHRIFVPDKKKNIIVGKTKKT
jgi:hypothetical protein